MFFWFFLADSCLFSMLCMWGLWNECSIFCELLDSNDQIFWDEERYLNIAQECFFFFTISWVVLCPSLASWLPDPGKMLLDSQRNCYNRDPEIQNALFSLCCYLCSFLFHFQRLVIESNTNVICVPCPQFFVLFLPCIFAFIQVILEFWVQNHLVGQINQITFTKILPLFVVHCSLWSK